MCRSQTCFRFERGAGADCPPLTKSRMSFSLLFHFISCPHCDGYCSVPRTLLSPFVDPMRSVCGHSVSHLHMENMADLMQWDIVVNAFISPKCALSIGAPGL
jgi:hypothetical protein